MFSPYRKKDVNAGQYVQLDFTRFDLGQVWVGILGKSDEVTRQMTGNPYIIEILGHGKQPFIPWEKLTNEEKKKLMTVFSDNGNILIGEPPIGF